MNKTRITTDPDLNQMRIVRDFDGPVDLVWKAWTDPDLLDRWWAPEPWRAETQSMDFREGGYWLYSMCGPDGERHWGRMDYDRIVEQESFEGRDVFCDEEGNPNTDLPAATWIARFTPTAHGTRVEMTTTYPTKEALEQILEMGVREGLTMAHDQLDELLKRELVK